MTEVIGFFFFFLAENVHFKEFCKVASALSECPAHDATVPGVTRRKERRL